MIKKLIDFIKSETGLYLFFGGCTTVISFVSFWAFLGLTGEVLANTIATIIAVTFAYITNKIFVFKSRSWSFSVLLKEIPSFCAARAFSYVVETGGLWFTSDVLHSGETGLLVAKIILSVIVIILNWVLSKFLVFKKEK